jgi:hypothetical protein
MNRSDLQVTVMELLGPRLDRLQRSAIAIGVVGLVLAVVGLVVDVRGFFHSYLYAYLLWLGATTGALIWLAVHHVTGGGWG